MCNELLNKKEYVNYQTGETLDLSKIKLLSEKAILVVKPDLWCIWNFEKNNELGFDIWKMTKGSNKKAWWICPKCKSCYDASIANRVLGKKCSYCSGRKVNNTNCLATTHVELLREWDFEKNISTTPYKVSHGSHEKVYWKCKTCHNSYQTSVYSKVNSKSCPFCAGKRVNNTNSLATKNPKLASQWHPTKNGELTPHDVTVSNGNKAWWLGECGHEWEAIIASRNKGIGCPYCSSVKTNIDNSLATLNPELAKEWHLLLNGEVFPSDVTPNSNKKAWWLGTCGHEWEAVISSRHLGVNCPYCAGQKVLKGFNDIWTTNPELAKLLANPKDGYKYTQNAKIKVDWKCPNCKNVLFKKRIQDVNKQTLSCEHCSSGISYPEKIMSKLLTDIGVEFIKDNALNWSNNKRYDFYIPSLNMIVETHGIQHYKEGFVNVGGRTLESEQLNDQYKRELAIINKILPENYIEIDCRKSDFEFIKNNILTSRLAELFDLSNVDWNEIVKSTKTSILKDVCTLWTNGMNTKEIVDYTNISRHTVIKYLKRGREIELCNYDPNEATLLSNLKNSKKVVGFNSEGELLKEYQSINQARKDMDTSHNKLVKVIKDKTMFNSLYWKIEDKTK